MKLATKIMQGTPSLIKVCKYPLTKDNTHNLARGSTTIYFFPFFSH